MGTKHLGDLPQYIWQDPRVAAAEKLILDELDRTGVLSDKFKQWIREHIKHLTQQCQAVYEKSKR